MFAWNFHRFLSSVEDYFFGEFPRIFISSIRIRKFDLFFPSVQCSSIMLWTCEKLTPNFDAHQIWHIFEQTAKKWTWKKKYEKNVVCVCTFERNRERETIYSTKIKRPRAFAISNGMRLFIYVQPKKKKSHTHMALKTLKQLNIYNLKRNSSTVQPKCIHHVRAHERSVCDINVNVSVYACTSCYNL